MSHMAGEEFHRRTCATASPMLVPLLISHYRGINRTRLQKKKLPCCVKLILTSVWGRDGTNYRVGFYSFLETGQKWSAEKPSVLFSFCCPFFEKHFQFSQLPTLPGFINGPARERLRLVWDTRSKKAQNGLQGKTGTDGLAKQQVQKRVKRGYMENYYRWHTWVSIRQTCIFQLLALLHRCCGNWSPGGSSTLLAAHST